MPQRKLAIILAHRNASLVHAAEAACDGITHRHVGFVGIGKTGSLFMQTVLELFAHEQLLTTPRRGNEAATSEHERPCAVGARMGWHHASATLWHRAFGTAWTRAYTFALVRNPWARLVSHWAFHLQSRSPLDGHLTPEQRRIAKANESASIDYFRAWVRHARSSFPPDSPRAWQFTTGDGHGNEHVRSFNASQLSWLVDAAGDALLVDEVFRLEDLEQRWRHLQSRVCGLRQVTYTMARQHQLVRAMDHPSSHAPFESYYDEETSRVVLEYMAPDVRRFGYKPPL